MLSNNNIHVSPISGNIVMHFEITGKFFLKISKSTGCTDWRSLMKSKLFHNLLFAVVSLTF